MLVFADAADHESYLRTLRRVAAEQQLTLHAYALVPSEVHLIVTPCDAASLSRAMQAVGRTYVASVNRARGRAGTLWQGRFVAAPFEAERYLVTLMRYVEQLPIQGALAVDPVDYPWSSAAHHAGRALSPLIADHQAFWRLGNTPFEREALYRQLLEEPVGVNDKALIQRLASKGWALGSPEYLREIGALAERRAAPLTPGRPGKTAK